jgi:hypothetical protein
MKRGGGRSGRGQSSYFSEFLGSHDLIRGGREGGRRVNEGKERGGTLTAFVATRNFFKA